MERAKIRKIQTARSVDTIFLLEVELVLVSVYGGDLRNGSDPNKEFY
jgi:hypothetical protein